MRGLVAALVLVACGFSGSAGVAAGQDGLNITSHIVYNIRPDEGARYVSWQTTIVNNDPSTSPAGSSGLVFFYEALSFPVMAGAQNLTATSGGTPLRIAISPMADAPLDEAEVTLDSPLFFGETVSIDLSYDIVDTRREGLLVNSAYAFVPVVAIGDTATIEVHVPPSQPWAATVEAAECSGEGSRFTCSGSDGVYLAAVAEVTRPDLTSSTKAEVRLKEKTLNLDISFFQGEEAFATHVKDLATAALPVMEELYGFNYKGPADIRLQERGRVITLGYEGLTACGDEFCSIAVSPVAVDHTILHELAHLWSDTYEKRWLAEGLAEFVARETAARLPAGLVSGAPHEFPQPEVELQLDDWGEVDVGAGLSGDRRKQENAGYFRSERFFVLLQAEIGLQAIQAANAKLAAAGRAADSRRFMDAIEEASGRNNDDLFREWVFPPSYAEVLSQRRQARDRLTTLIARAQEERLSDRIPGEIEGDLADWDFDAALTALDDLDQAFATFLELKPVLASLRERATGAGLSIGGDLDDALAEWDFDRAGRLVGKAEEALTRYLTAREKIDQPRNLWERFGLLGSDPEGDLKDAATAFNSGDYDRARSEAGAAIDAIDSASSNAARRVLLVTGAAGIFAMVVLLVVWYSRRHEQFSVG